MEPQVLEQHHAAARRVHAVHRALRVVADAIVRRTSPAGRGVRQPIGDRPEAHLRIGLALRPAQMAGEDDGRALIRARVGSSAATLECACRRQSRPSFSGTLKSTRTKTRLPLRSRSRIESFAMSIDGLKGRRYDVATLQTFQPTFSMRSRSTQRFE